MALFGLCTFSHFNSLRTFGVLLPALAGRVPKWSRLRSCLWSCWHWWGSATSWGLFTSCNLAGCGFPKVESEDPMDKFVKGFKRLWNCTALADAVKAIDGGINSMDAVETLSHELQRVAKTNPGALGSYHLKPVFDQVHA